MSIGGIIVDCGSTPSSQPGSPTRTKVKFSCSYGGKILPRPANGHLKYVGGETRVISVPIDITFQDLMKKLTYLMDGEMILKYQIIPEELETLVTVKTNEDMQLMFEECNRYENTGAPRLKTFLFPGKPPLVDNATMEHQASLEQRYLDAINGVVRPPAKRQLPINANYGASFASSPTKSPENYPADILNMEPSVGSIRQSAKRGMQRVRSSPSICSLGKQQEGSLKTSNFHHDYHKQRQQSNYNDHISKPVLDPDRGGTPERLMSVRSMERERVRYLGDSFAQYPQLPIGYTRYHGGCSKFMQHDDCSPYMRHERGGSLPVSPLQLSPRGNSHMRRVWETPPTGDY